MNTPDPQAEHLDVLLRVRGTVQGVGFRPFVHRAASRLGLRGWVLNDGKGVLMRVEGKVEQVASLELSLKSEAPPAALVAVVVRSLPDADSLALPDGPGFHILASDTAGAGIGTAVPADLALCTDCRRELLNPGDRRHRYPFINCTQCGPRYSIIEALPYDRERTTMRRFRMCVSCRDEYELPGGRRHHAEPNACPACGPRLTLSGPGGVEMARGEEALGKTIDGLGEGRIVAVKGLGGFHLMCDAGSSEAVARLRKAKHRDEKPFAVMFSSLSALREEAVCDDAAATYLSSSACPVLLLPRREGGRLSPLLAPGNPWVGALLAYTPVHVLLLRAFGGPLVATSANLSEEPLCTDDQEASVRLEGIADLFLGNDRPILRPVDDSVLRLDGCGQPVLLRRARGFAPAPLDLPVRIDGALLCVGGQMKNTVGVASGERLVLSPHIGDLANAATQEAFEHTIHTLAQLCDSRFDRVACDKHPDYASSLWAERSGLPCVRVQHHLAHLLACLLEHKRRPEEVLGVVWDGTGYGEDGSVWGGEFLLAREGRVSRFAHVRPFRLPGGGAAARDARRVATALLLACDSSATEDARRRFALTDSEGALLPAMIARGINSPWCTSVGRLFDAVGLILGLGRSNSFEGQIPLSVEAAAARGGKAEPLPFAVRASSAGARLELDWEPALRLLLRSTGASHDAARAFHFGLAEGVVRVAREAGAHTVALSGGCFQNMLLLDATRDALGAAGFEVLVHRQLPPNDGAISAGQAAAVAWGLHSVELKG